MINNLAYPVERFMFNQDIGTDYVDIAASSKQKRLLLALKKEGLTLPGFVATAVPGSAPSAGSGSLPDTILSIKKSTTQYATKNGGIIWLKDDAPCGDCNFSYHLNFRKVVERPGEENFETNMYYRYYGGTIARPEISGSSFTDATMIAIENDLINQITNDYVSTDLIDKHDRAICEARRAYIITDNGTNDASSVVLTKPDGTTVTYTSDGSFGNLDEKINAGGLLLAYRLSASRYLITSVTKGYIYTLTAGTDVTVVKHGIHYNAISTEVRAIPSFDISFGEIELLSIMTITGHTGKIKIAGKDADGQFSVESAAYTNTNALTRAGVINTANSLGRSYFAHGPSTTTEVVTVVSLGIRTLTAINSNGGTNTFAYKVNDFGKWGYLTGTDVFRLFSMKPVSMRPQWQHLDQPSETSEWNKYTINIKSNNQPGAAGAGGGDLVATERTIMLYVRKDLSAVSTFETILQKWANLNIADW